MDTNKHPRPLQTRSDGEDDYEMRIRVIVLAALVGTKWNGALNGRHGWEQNDVENNGPKSETIQE